MGLIGKAAAKKWLDAGIESGDLIRVREGVMRAKDFFALPPEKQIELKQSVPRVRADHWRKGRPKP
jgi:hypothetical protein